MAQFRIGLTVMAIVILITLAAIGFAIYSLATGKIQKSSSDDGKGNKTVLSSEAPPSLRVDNASVNMLRF